MAVLTVTRLLLREYFQSIYLCDLLVHLKRWLASSIYVYIKRKARILGIPLEHIIVHQGLLYKEQTFWRLLHSSSVTTNNDPPSDYSWAKPCLTIDRVIRRLVRLSAVS